MPFDMQDYVERAQNALSTLSDRQKLFEPEHPEFIRLGGKIEGVALMLDYLRAYKE